MAAFSGVLFEGIRRTRRPGGVREVRGIEEGGRSGRNAGDFMTPHVLNFQDSGRRSNQMEDNINSLLTSPIPGPPKTRMSSLDDPPLSLIGMILQQNYQHSLRTFPTSFTTPHIL